MADAKTPRVQLHLHLQGEERREEPRQRVLKATAGHEVVEAHWRGVAFQFSKKRKAEAPPAPTASRLPAPPSHLLRTPGSALTTAATTAAPSPFADDVWVTRQQGERLLAGVAALPERAPPAQRLLAFAASLGEAAVAGAGPRAAALAGAYASFQDKLAAALTSGRVQLAAPPRPPATPGEDGEEVEQQRDYTVDLEARKAGLRARLAAFEKEEAEWHALVEKVAQLDRQQLVAADAHAADPAAAGGVAEPGAQQQQEQQGEEQQEVPEEVAALARLHKDVHRHLAMQVEGVCKLVSDVEEMVERANRSAQAVQAEYQAEKLRVFPHINSPARLIRELVRPAAGPAAAAPASPGGKAQQGMAAAAADGKENALEA